MDASGVVHDNPLDESTASAATSTPSTSPTDDGYRQFSDPNINNGPVRSTDSKIRIKIPKFLSPSKGSFRNKKGITLENEDSESTASNLSTAEGHPTSMMSDNSLQQKYEAESPDELALVKAACTYGCRLLAKSADYVTVWLPGRF